MHHTKSKADIGVAQVIADLASKGCVPCLPLSEHQSKAIRFDKPANNQNKNIKWAKTCLDITERVLRDYTPHTCNGEDIVQTTTPEK